jgi:alkylated DNA repair dioxygenase AlkB
VLINRYLGGDDSMGFHSDDDWAMGPDPFLLSVSLGCSRDFIVKTKEQPRRRFVIPLPHGSVLLMYGRRLQTDWVHGIEKQHQVKDMRINLSFRYHMTQQQVSQLKEYKRKHKSTREETFTLFQN